MRGVEVGALALLAAIGAGSCSAFLSSPCPPERHRSPIQSGVFRRASEQRLEASGASREFNAPLPPGHRLSRAADLVIEWSSAIGSVPRRGATRWNIVSAPRRTGRNEDGDGFDEVTNALRPRDSLRQRRDVNL
jgi:hypothetical protein